MTHLFAGAVTTGFSRFLEKIIQLTSPEKIFLLSVCRQGKCVQTIFLEAPFEYQKFVSYEVLVLVPECAEHRHYELQDMIESAAADFASVTAIVLPVRQFNDWFREGHPFACKVYVEAMLCYDKGTRVPEIPAEYDNETKDEVLRQEFGRHCRLADEFLAGAELFITRKNHGLAAFNLHQAAEQSYAGIIHYVMGWRVQTHSLDRLLRYAEYLLPGMAGLFPRDTETEKRLFRFLQKAYSDTRYKKDYTIKYTDLLVLLTRVKKLLQLCQNLQRSIPTTS